MKNIDGFVTGAGFPDWGYHGYWADDFTRLDRALRNRGGAEGVRRRLPRPRHPRAPRRGLQPRRLRLALPDRPADEGLARAPRRPAPAARTTSRRASSGLPDFKTELPGGRRVPPRRPARAGRSDPGSTASGSTPSSTSITRSGRSIGAGAGKPSGRASSCSARSGAATRRSSTPGSRATRWTPASTSPSREASSAGSCWGAGRTVAFDRYLQSREKVRAGLSPVALPLVARRPRGAVAPERRRGAASAWRPSSSSRPRASR